MSPPSVFVNLCVFKSSEVERLRAHTLIAAPFIVNTEINSSGGRGKKKDNLVSHEQKLYIIKTAKVVFKM